MKTATCKVVICFIWFQVAYILWVNNKIPNYIYWFTYFLTALVGGMVFYNARKARHDDGNSGKNP